MNVPGGVATRAWPRPVIVAEGQLQRLADTCWPPSITAAA